MNLTPELKAEIDNKSHYELLCRWRFHPIGDPIFQDESGEYFGKRMAELRTKDPEQAIVNSKTLGF